MIETIANILSGILILLLFVVVARGLRRKKIARVFGISKDKPYARIYVSRLQVIPGGTIAVGSANVNQGYKGAAINYVEYEGARAIRQTLQSRAFMLLPQGLQKILASIFGRYQTFKYISLNIPIEAGPLYDDEQTFKTVHLAAKIDRRCEPPRTLQDKMKFIGIDKELWEALELRGEAKTLTTYNLNLRASKLKHYSSES